MTTQSSVTIDLVSQTIVDIFTLNDVISTNITLQNNQIVLGLQPSNAVSVSDFGLKTAQEQLFYNAVLINFPQVTTQPNHGFGNTCQFNLTEYRQGTPPYITYTFANGGIPVASYTWSPTSGLVSWSARTSTYTVGWYAFVNHLQELNKFYQEIQRS